MYILDSREHFNFLSYFSDFAVCIDAHGIIQQATESSQGFLQLPSKLMHDSIQSLIQPEDMVLFTEAQERAHESGEKQLITCRLLRQRVLPVWVDCQVFPQQKGECLLVAFDVSHWKENETRLLHLSTHDELTGLPSRVLLDDRINTSIRLAQREKSPLALVLLDLDSFKRINDTLGHNTGDELLKAVARRLEDAIRRSDSLIRIGGNGFCLVMTGVGEDTIKMITRKILVAMQRSFYIEGHTLRISASFGAAIYPQHGYSSSILYRCAELAMYKAKSLGKNRWKLYSDQFDPAEQGDLPLESAMHEGIKNGEFLLHYQPIFSAKNGKLKGAEALMRWESSSYGPVSPIKFISLAENNGLIKILGAWALRSACHQAKLWQEAGHSDFYISVNVSPRQFVQEDFLMTLDQALSGSGLLPEHLMLEITEGVLMDNPERTTAMLVRLREMGVKIAIDDFGTGYSSLAYLKKFPLTVLKIDKVFVDNVAHNTEDLAIVNAILSLAKGLGLIVVAEGVEDQAQLDLLKKRGCDLIQGYLTGRPVSTENFKEQYIV